MKSSGKIMLGFLIRRCAHAIGHEPTAEEFAVWANNFREHPGERARYLFGRPITVAEAQVILRHPGREVSTRLKPPANPVAIDGTVDPNRVVRLLPARRRVQRVD